MKYKTVKILFIIGIALSIIALITCITLYFTTDLLKSNKTLFEKYFTESLSDISEMTDISSEEKYINSLREKNYNDNSNLKIKYRNSQGNVEEFNSTISGSTDNTNNNSHRKINIKFGENIDVINTEFLKEDKMYGILLSDVVGKFACIDANKIDIVLNKFGFDKNQIEKYDISKLLKTYRENKDGIKDIISEIVDSTENKQYESHNNIQIALNNGETKATKEYILTLSKEQTKKVVLNILKQFKQDELVKNITYGNREFSSAKCSLYVSDKKVHRITVKYENLELVIDKLDKEIDIKYTDENSKTMQINIKDSEQKKIVEYKDFNDNTIKCNFYTNQNQTTGEALADLDIQNFQFEFEQKIEFTNNIQIERNFANSKSIVLNSKDEKFLSSSLGSLAKRINERLEIVQKNLNSEIIGFWIKEDEKIVKQYEQMTENSKKDYNNQFISYQGQNIGMDIINNMLDVVANNILKYEITGENKFKIYLQEGKNDTQMVREIKSYIKEDVNSFNVELQYDKNGKVSVILLEQYVEPER